MRDGIKTPQPTGLSVGAAVASKRPEVEAPVPGLHPPPPGSADSDDDSYDRDGQGTDLRTQGYVSDCFPVEIVGYPDPGATTAHPIQVGINEIVTVNGGGLITPTAERSCQPRHDAVKSCTDMCNTGATDVQLCAAVDSFCCTTCVMGMEAARKGGIDLDSVLAEKADGGVRGIAGQVMPLVGRFNGITFYFYGKAIVIDVYVMREWHMGKVDLLIGYDTLVKYRGVSDFAKGITTFHDLNLVIGRGNAQHAAPVAPADWTDQVAAMNAVLGTGGPDQQARPAGAPRFTTVFPEKVSVVVLVGAPRAGKSQCKQLLMNHLSLADLHVVHAEEGATEVLRDMGSPPFEEGDEEKKAEFQRRVMLRAQHNLAEAKATAETLLATRTWPVLVVADRCPHCCLCFMDDKAGRDLCDAHEVPPMSLEYDLVLLLQSSSTAAGSEYVMASGNNLRFHDEQQSEAIERRAITVYSEHHNVVTVPYCDDMADKVRLCLVAICRQLGLAAPPPTGFGNRSPEQANLPTVSSRQAATKVGTGKTSVTDAAMDLMHSVTAADGDVDVTPHLAAIASARLVTTEVQCGACASSGESPELVMDCEKTQWVDCPHGVVQVSGPATDPRVQYSYDERVERVVCGHVAKAWVPLDRAMRCCALAACRTKAVQWYRSLPRPESCGPAVVTGAVETPRLPSALKVSQPRCRPDGTVVVKGSYADTFDGDPSAFNEYYPGATNDPAPLHERPITHGPMGDTHDDATVYHAWPTPMSLTQRLIHEYTRFLVCCSERGGSPFGGMATRMAQFTYWLSKAMQASYLDRHYNASDGSRPEWVTNMLNSIKGSSAQGKIWAVQAKAAFEPSLLNQICHDGPLPAGVRTTAPKADGLARVHFSKSTDQCVCSCDELANACRCSPGSTWQRVPFKDLNRNSLMPQPRQDHEYAQSLTEGAERRWAARVRQYKFMRPEPLARIKRHLVSNHEHDPLRHMGCPRCGCNRDVGHCICNVVGSSQSLTGADKLNTVGLPPTVSTSADDATTADSRYYGKQPSCAKELRDVLQTVHGDNLRDELLLPGIDEQEAHLNLSGLSLYSHGGGWRREDAQMMIQAPEWIEPNLSRALTSMGAASANGKSREMHVRRTVWRQFTLARGGPWTLANATSECLRDALKEHVRYSLPIDEVTHVSAADKTAHLAFLENAKRDAQPVLLKVPEQWFNVASALAGAVEASVCATASWADEVAGLDKERLYAYTPLLDHENGSIQIGAMMYHHGGQQHITLDIGACEAALIQPGKTALHRTQQGLRYKLASRQRDTGAGTDAGGATRAADPSATVGALLTHAQGFRKPGCPFKAPSGLPPITMTPAIREALNAESERMQVIRNVMLPHVNIDKYKKQFANAYTAEDLLPQNMMKVIWRPGWEADVPKHGLRPQSPAQLKVIIEHIKSFVAAGWLARWKGPNPPVIHPIFCITKPTPPEELAPGGSGQRYRVLVDAQMGNSLCLPPSGPVDTTEGVISNVQDASRESLRQAKANAAGTRRLVPTNIPIGPDDNWLDAKGRPHPERPTDIPAKPAGYMQRIEGDEVELGTELEIPEEVWLSINDVAKAFHRVLISDNDGVSRSRVAFSCKGLHSIWVATTAAMGHSHSPSEFVRFIRRKARKYGILFDEEATQDEVLLDPSPRDLGDGRPPSKQDSLASICGFDGVFYPSPTRFALVYCDDIICVAATEDEGFRQMKMLLLVCQVEHLWLSSEKMLLGCAAVSLLGVMVSHRVVMPDPTRVTDIAKQQPCTLERVWSQSATLRFIGQIGFYRQFLTNASKFLRPLSELTALKNKVTGDSIPKNDVSSHWTKPCNSDDPKVTTHWITLTGGYILRRNGEVSCEDGFHGALQDLAQLCLRYQPNQHAEWRIATDSSQYGWGGFGTQRCPFTGENLPIFIIGGPLSAASTRKSATVRELRAIVNTFDKKGSLFRGSNPMLVVITDHAANHGVQDRFVCNQSEIMTLRMKMEENRPYRVVYSQGKSRMLDIPDAQSRLITPGWDKHLDDPELTIFDDMDKVTCWKMFWEQLEQGVDFGSYVASAQITEPRALLDIIAANVSVDSDVAPTGTTLPSFMLSDDQLVVGEADLGHDAFAMAQVKKAIIAAFKLRGPECTTSRPPLCRLAAHAVVVVVYAGDEVLLQGVPDPVRPRWRPITFPAIAGRHSTEQAVQLVRRYGFGASTDTVHYQTVVTVCDGMRLAVYSAEVSKELARPGQTKITADGQGERDTRKGNWTEAHYVSTTRWAASNRLPSPMRALDRALIHGTMHVAMRLRSPGRSQIVYDIRRKQDLTYQTALQEMKDGAKVTCWSWWIWPAQFRNESSSTSKKWSVKVSEAAEFVEDDELRERWVEIVTVTLRQMQLQFAASKKITLLSAPDLNRLVESCRLMGSVAIGPDNRGRPQCEALRVLAKRCVRWVTEAREASRSHVSAAPLQTERWWNTRYPAAPAAPNTLMYNPWGCEHDLDDQMDPRNRLCKCPNPCPPRGSDTGSGSHYFHCDRHYRQYLRLRSTGALPEFTVGANRKAKPGHKPASQFAGQVATGKWCTADCDIFITAKNDTLAGVAARIRKDCGCKLTVEQLAVWHADRVDLGSKLLKAATRFEADTRLRSNGPSVEADSSAPEPSAEMKPGSPEFDKLIQELATRGFFVQMGADKDDLRKMGLSSTLVTPEHYKGSPYEQTYLEATSVPNDRGFVVEGRLLRYVDPACGDRRLVIPNADQQQALVKHVHESELQPHMSAGRTYVKLKRDFYWSGMDRDVTLHYARCVFCQRNQHLRRGERGAPTPWDGEPLGPGTWHVDMLTGLPESKSVLEYNSVMVLVCRWSGFVIAVPTHNTLDAPGFATLIFRELVCRLGETPRAIVTDRAAIFTAAYTETWCALMGIVTMKTTAHRSARVNGLVEVTIQQLEAAIRAGDLLQSSWLSRVLPACGAINTSAKTTSGISPIEMKTGRQPVSNLSLSPELSEACHPDAAERVAQQHLVWDQAVNAITNARRITVERLGATRLKPHWLDVLKVGDRVLVESKTLSTPAFKAGLVNRKMEPRYYGPYEVLSYVGRRTVELKLPPHSRAWPRFHVSRIKPFNGGDSGARLPRLSNDDEYEVKAIVAQRVRRKKPQYLVQWAPPYDAHEHMTWQSADDVKNSEKLVKQFEQRREAMQEYDASQRFDFDHLMAPATVVGSTTHAKWSPSISNDDRVRLGAFTAMQLKLERWTNDVL